MDKETKEFLFYIDATDLGTSNWMRYINCARHFDEQNIISEQIDVDIFYKVIKVRPSSMDFSNLVRHLRTACVSATRQSQLAAAHCTWMRRTEARLQTQPRPIDRAGLFYILNSGSNLVAVGKVLATERTRV